MTAAMQADRRVVRPGETFQLLICLRIAGGYYIYSTNSPHGPFTPLEIDLMPPETLELKGDWIGHKPINTTSGEKVYMDSVLLTRLVRVRPHVPDQLLTIEGELECQACSEELCWPPRQIKLSTSVEVLSKMRK